MGVVVLCAVFTILMAFILGAFLNMFKDSDSNSVAESYILTAVMFLFVLCILGFICKNQEYFEKKEYSATEYHLNRKTITVKENNAVKVDTLYSFGKRK